MDWHCHEFCCSNTFQICIVNIHETTIYNISFLFTWCFSNTFSVRSIMMLYEWITFLVNLAGPIIYNIIFWSKNSFVNTLSVSNTMMLYVWITSIVNIGWTKYLQYANSEYLVPQLSFYCLPTDLWQFPCRSTCK